MQFLSHAREPHPIKIIHGERIAEVTLAVVMSSLTEGADSHNNETWSSASREGRVDLAKLALENGDKVDLQAENRWSSLMLTCHKGHVDVAILLLEKGAQVDLQAEYGLSSLMVACHNGHVDVPELLLEKGAQVRRLTEKGWVIIINGSM